MKQIAINDLRDLLNEGSVSFSFTKKDGSERESFGTTSKELIPEDKMPKSSLRFFDLDLGEWRSIPAETEIVTLLKEFE